jgi:hypothetical protein
MPVTNSTVDDVPKAKIFRERIGDTDYELREEKLDVFDEIRLWDGNPRLLPYLAEASTIQSEEDLENHLKQTGGYGTLAKSIADIGQMEPVYIWKRDDQTKYLVIEGATRVTILRDLARRHANRPDEAKYRYVKAKVLRPEFGLDERVILLAKIHVRGTGVRSWGRFIEARFIYDAVIGKDSQKPISVTQLAQHMGKSASWVSRLKDAYLFAHRFVEHCDSPDAERQAVDHFSTLEEIAKCRDIGPKLRDYDNASHDDLRTDVFDMVRREVFKEYRDARFMREFHDDPEKWTLLKTGERHIANKLATELKAGHTSLRGKVEALAGQLERTLERDPDAINEDDVDHLRKAVKVAESFFNPGVEKFRLELLAFKKALESVSLAEIKSVKRDEVEAFDEALDDFRTRLAKHKTWD